MLRGDKIGVLRVLLVSYGGTDRSVWSDKGSVVVGVPKSPKSNKELMSSGDVYWINSFPAVKYNIPIKQFPVCPNITSSATPWDTCLKSDQGSGVLM